MNSCRFQSGGSPFPCQREPCTAGHPQCLGDCPPGGGQSDDAGVRDPPRIEHLASGPLRRATPQLHADVLYRRACVEPRFRRMAVPIPARPAPLYEHAVRARSHARWHSESTRWAVYHDPPESRTEAAQSHAVTRGSHDRWGDIVKNGLSSLHHRNRASRRKDAHSATRGIVGVRSPP